MSCQPSPQLPELTHSTAQPAYASPYSRRLRPFIRVDTSSSSLAETSSAPPTFRYSPTQPPDAPQNHSPQAIEGSSYQYSTDPHESSFHDHEGTYDSTHLHSPTHLHPSPNLLFAAPASSPQQQDATDQLPEELSFDDRSLFFPDP